MKSDPSVTVFRLVDAKETIRGRGFLLYTAVINQKEKGHDIRKATVKQRRTKAIELAKSDSYEVVLSR